MGAGSSREREGGTRSEVGRSGKRGLGLGPAGSIGREDSARLTTFHFRVLAVLPSGALRQLMDELHRAFAL